MKQVDVVKRSRSLQRQIDSLRKKHLQLFEDNIEVGTDIDVFYTDQRVVLTVDEVYTDINNIISVRGKVKQYKDMEISVAYWNVAMFNDFNMEI